MSVIPTAALAITNAFARHERASEKLLSAVQSGEGGDAAHAIAEQIEAKHQLKASVGVVRIADDMLQTLLDISRRSTANS